MDVDADGWFCNYCNGMADHLSSAHPGSKCTPERCTEANKPMIQRAHTPRTCPAAPPNAEDLETHAEAMWLRIVLAPALSSRWSKRLGRTSVEAMSAREDARANARALEADFDMPDYTN